MEDKEVLKVINDLVENQAGRSVAYIKITKNTKGYSWEFKMLSLDVDEVEKLNNEICIRFGEQDGN